MRDEQCVRFLQWALPRLQMQWSGFRKVRKQVCKRVDRRRRDLGLADIDDYQAYLEAHRDEWQHLDSLCTITISRFYRDKGVFSALAQEVLPDLITNVRHRSENVLRAWTAGCASGEEPYSLAILWARELQAHFPDVTINIVGTDADPHMIRRANAARYRSGCLKELPETWREQAFVREDDVYMLAPEIRRFVEFRVQDIRQVQPPGSFDIVLCRNLIYTYYEEALQARLSTRIVDTMHDGGALVLGVHERLPDGVQGLSVWLDKERVYRKSRTH